MTAASVGFLGWMALAGVLLLVMALSSGRVRRMPVSTALIYLIVGFILGPFGVRWLQLDLLALPRVVARVTEVAVIVALFIGGLELRLPLRDPAWNAAYRLAGPVMVLSIVGVALAGRLLFALDWALCLLLGAVLAPTDPVLEQRRGERFPRSGSLTLRSFGRSRLERRDGVSLRGVRLDLVITGSRGRLGGHLGTGEADLGRACRVGTRTRARPCSGRLAIWLRAREPESNAPNDLLMLALICLSYVLAEQVGAWGFLAVFAAGVGLRRAEIQVVRGNPHPDHLRTGNEDDIPASHPPAEHMVAASVEPRALNEPAVAAGVLVAESLSFGETLERLIEFVLVLLIGVASSSHYEPRALLLGATLLLVVRPLATALLLIGTKTSSAQRCLMAWFGVRGVGSLYYVSYALSHGLEGEAA